MRGDTFSAELLQYIRDNPGVSGREIHQHFLGRSKATVSSTLGRLRREGILENRGNGGRWSVWHPAEHAPVAPEFVEMAHVLWTELVDIYPVSEREAYLARRLEELFMQDIFKEIE